MSYADNIKLTLKQLVNKMHRNTAWIVKHRKSYWVMNIKLHHYVDKAGETPVVVTPPLTVADVQLGWAGKRTKEKMVARGRVGTTHRRNKVGRYIHQRNDGSLTQKLYGHQAYPILPIGGVELTQPYDYVVFVRNGKKGYVQFYTEGAPVLKVDWVENKEMTEEEQVTAWHGITVKAPDAEVARPMLWVRWKPAPIPAE